MPLTTHVTDRYGSRYLVPLTNDSSAATTVDAARLALAADDVEGDFTTVLGRDYVDTNGGDVSVAVQGVIGKLILYMGQHVQSGTDMHEAYLRRLRGLRSRVIPDSSSLMTPVDELRGKSTIPPRFDDAEFDAYLPNSPQGGS